MYKSEYNLERENNALLLMINHNEKYYCFAVKGKLELYSSEWLRSKTESITKKDNYFQNASNDSLDYQRIKKNPQKISKLRPYINQYNWKDIKFPSVKDDWKKFEQNNNEIALNKLFVPHNKKEIEPAYISKYNYKRKKQVILLMITDDDNRWHYLAVKSLPALFRGITSSNNGDFYCLNCFHSYRTLNKLKKHERVCNNHDYCRIDMPEEHEKIKYLPGEKSLKVPFIIYADLEYLLKKVQSCQNNPENSYTEKKVKHKPSGYAWCSICSFDDTKNRRYFYMGKDRVEKFCKDLKDLETEIINFEEYHYTGKFRGAAHSGSNLRYKVPKEIPIVFHNGSTYDYHFIIKKLAEEFKGEFECLGENAEKYITFSVPLKKENDNDKKYQIQIKVY